VCDIVAEVRSWFHRSRGSISRAAPAVRPGRGWESTWVGYKVHVTETCDAGAPHLIVNVETTPATTPDDNMLAVIHQSLECQDLLPAEHLVDKGYTDAGVLVDSRRDHGVAVIGPVADDPSWQARSEDGFDKSRFVVDWDRQRVTCPAGKRSISWLPKTNPKSVIQVEARFSGRDCTPCPLRSRCTRSKGRKAQSCGIAR
jgi:transposase